MRSSSPLKVTPSSFARSTGTRTPRTTATSPSTRQSDTAPSGGRTHSGPGALAGHCTTPNDVTAPGFTRVLPPVRSTCRCCTQSLTAPGRALVMSTSSSPSSSGTQARPSGAGCPAMCSTSPSVTSKASSYSSPAAPRRTAGSAACAVSDGSARRRSGSDTDTTPPRGTSKVTPASAFSHSPESDAASGFSRWRPGTNRPP